MSSAVKIEASVELPHAPSEVWPLASQIGMLMCALGFPPLFRSVRPLPEGGVEVRGQTRFLGRRLRWSQAPTEWLEEEFIRNRALFDQGPWESVEATLELRSRDGLSTHLRLLAEVRPRDGWGRWLAAHVVAPRLIKDLKQIG